MDIPVASRRVILGETIAHLAAVYRLQLIESVGLTVEEATASTFRKEALRFAGKVCRHLAERHASDGHVETALAEWAHQVEDYDAFDALLATFRDFDGRPALLRRGKALFPGPLTAHWDDQ